jgi:molybdopterin converting factor small subunit
MLTPHKVLQVPQVVVKQLLQELQKAITKKEERSFKQRYIVHQNNINNAIDNLSFDTKTPLSPIDFIAITKQFKEWTFSEKQKPALDSTEEDLDSDIIF